jgi:hypothetical protein
MSAVHANDNPRYRPDVDGLRAVAILSVVAFHAFPDLIQGGFVGVDVFLRHLRLPRFRPEHDLSRQLSMSLLPEEVCVTNSTAPKVMFFGDSHAMGLYSAIFADHLAVPSVLIASPGCLVYPNLTYRPKGKEWGQNCTDIAKKGLEYANRSPDIGTVVISMVRKGDNPDSLTNFYSGDRADDGARGP